MAITVANYGRFNECLLEGRVNLASDEIWCMLMTNAYVFNKNNHKFKNSVTGEVIGSGYTGGGKKVGFSPPTYDSVTYTTKVPASNLAWPVVTFAGVTGAILYVKRQGVAESAMPLMSYIAFGETISRNDQAFYLNLPPTGVLKLAAP